MKYTNGGFPFKASPAKQKENTTPHFLEQKPNPTVKAKKVDHSKTLSTHLDSRGPIKGDYQMENKGDFNISNLHKDTKMSLKDGKAHNIAANITEGSIESQALLRKKNAGGPKKPMYPPTRKGSKQRSAAEKALEAKEDAEGK